jgi:hypothetical protein
MELCDSGSLDDANAHWPPKADLIMLPMLVGAHPMQQSGSLEKGCFFH